MAENVATEQEGCASPHLEIVLASGSPRRQQFLHDLELSFKVITADIDETPKRGEAPVELVKRLSTAKAYAVVRKLPLIQSMRLLIAADTIVANDGQLLGKPLDHEDAIATLRRLRNKIHQVISSFTVLHLDEELQIIGEKTVVNTSNLHMRNYTDEEIATYVATGDPLDKAGAYAIQHPTFAPGEMLDGCISSVMGLPLADLAATLNEFGIRVKKPIPPLCEGYAGFSCCQK